jgi:hypothetical protein
MATDSGVQTQSSEGGGMGNYGWIGDMFASHQGREFGGQKSTVTKGDGDVSMLKKVLEEMAKSTDAEGMTALFQQIFKKGFEEQMPKLLSNANTAGIRPQDATTQTLMQNDLMARLTGASMEALGKQQASYGQLAGQYASLTEKPVVTTVQGEGKISGSTDAFSTIGSVLGF